MSWTRKATEAEVGVMVAKAQDRIEDLSKALNAMVDSGKITQQEISILNDQIEEAHNMLDAAIRYLQPHQETGYRPLLQDAD